MFCDDAQGYAFEVPERTQWKMGDQLPDTPLEMWSRHESGIGRGNLTPLFNWLFVRI